MEDSRIIELFWQRDEQALLHTQEKYGAYCTRLARNILDDEEDAVECVNDTWLRVWSSIPPERPKHLQYFLARITRNLALDRYRQEHAVKRGGGTTDVALEELSQVLASRDDPQKSCEAKELESAINRFVGRLPRREGDLFIRRYYFLESISDIAQRFGLTTNHVTVILSRTRRKLKAHLEKEGLL